MSCQTSPTAAPRLRLALAGFALVGLAAAVGCSVKAPRTATWTVGARQRTTNPLLDPDGPALAVQRFNSSPEVSSTNLTWRESDGSQILRRPYHLWADYPDRMIEELAIAVLAGSGRFSAVGPPAAVRKRDAVLTCRLVEFSEWMGAAGPEVRVALRCTLADNEGEVLDIFQASASERSHGQAVASVVRAFSNASEAAVTEVVERTASRLAARAEAEADSD